MAKMDDFLFNEKRDEYELRVMCKDLFSMLLVKTAARKDPLSKHWQERRHVQLFKALQFFRAKLQGINECTKDG